jgi:Hg(II)-responsive transcriptional regulator
MALRIGQLAEQTHVNKETIRYYERLGLIPPPSRTKSGYRIYKIQSVDRVNFIKKMQALGFTLKEIDQLLGVVDRNEVKCADIYDFTVNKIDEVRRKIGNLKRIEKMLMDLKERCPDNKQIYQCPIIETVKGLKEVF